MSVFDVQVVAPDLIYQTEVDVFAPCAKGAVLNDETIPQPRAKVVAGAAKLSGSEVKVLGFFGDGATSRSEFHSAMNFAGIHQPPVIFMCVNNSWAVSTPLNRQTAQPNFAAKGDAYGVRNLRVDGNDPLAVYAVTKAARASLAEQGPILIEAVTYRLGYH